MTRVRGSIDIERPVEEVFDTLADQRLEVRYNEEMTSSVKLTEGPIGVGTRFHATLRDRRPLGVDIEFTRVQRPHLLASRSVTAGTVADGALALTSVPGGTRLTWDWQVRLPRFDRLAGPLVWLLGSRQERRIWTGLKRYLEGGAR